MVAKELRELLHAQPFMPFAVNLPSGKSLAVPHPEFASLSPGGRVLMVWSKSNVSTRVDTLLIESIAELPVGVKARAQRDRKRG